MHPTNDGDDYDGHRIEYSESSQIQRLRTDCTGWIRSEQMTTDLEESSGARRPKEIPHNLSFAGVQLVTRWILAS